MKTYPSEATERFDSANFHIKYCLHFLKKYLSGNILEVGAGCGSFTKNYYNKKIRTWAKSIDKNFDTASDILNEALSIAGTEIVQFFQEEMKMPIKL